MRLLLFILILCSNNAFCQSSDLADIYGGDTPQVMPLWHRVADFSPRLRSVEAAAFSPDGRLAVSGAKFGYGVMLWRVADGALLWENHHESEVECVAFSPDGKQVASAGEDYTIRIWEVASGEQLKIIRASFGFDGLAWSPDGKFIVGGAEGGEVVFYDAATYQKYKTVGCGSDVNSLHFTADGKRVLVGGNIQTPDPKGPGGKRYDGFVSVIEVAKFEKTAHRIIEDGSVKSVRWSPDEKHYATAGFDGKARLFDAVTNNLVATFTEPHKIEAVTFSPDGQYLLTGGHDLAINWYCLTDRKLALRQPSARVEYLDFTADGRLLLSSHEDSGLLSCYLILSNVQGLKNYQEIADKQLNNLDLKN